MSETTYDEQNSFYESQNSNEQANEASFFSDMENVYKEWEEEEATEDDQIESGEISGSQIGEAIGKGLGVGINVGRKMSRELGKGLMKGVGLGIGIGRGLGKGIVDEVKKYGNNK